MSRYRGEAGPWGARPASLPLSPQVSRRALEKLIAFEPLVQVECVDAGAFAIGGESRDEAARAAIPGESRPIRTSPRYATPPDQRETRGDTVPTASMCRLTRLGHCTTARDRRYCAKLRFGRSDQSQASRMGATLTIRECCGPARRPMLCRTGDKLGERITADAQVGGYTRRGYDCRCVSRVQRACCAEPCCPPDGDVSGRNEELLPSPPDDVFTPPRRCEVVAHRPRLNSLRPADGHSKAIDEFPAP